MILWKTDPDILLDRVHTSLEPDRSAVQAQIIIAAVIPVMSCIVLIVFCTIFVCLLYVLHRRFAAERSALFRLFQTIVRIGIDEHPDQIFSPFQDEITTAPDDDTGLLIRQCADDLCLIVEKVLIRQKVSALRRNDRSVVSFPRDAEQ